MAPGAVAESMSHAQFDAALATAVDAAGVFAKGTTLVVDLHEPYDTRSLELRVNPDGSLVFRENIFDRVLYSYTCVRVDRCWHLSLGTYGNLKWHPLPAGVVKYRQASVFWTSWLGADWPADATYDVAAAPDGSQVFTVTWADEGGVWSKVTTIKGPRLTSVDAYTGRPAEQTTVLTMSARAKAIAVAAPAPRTVGRPALRAESWSTLINR